MLFQFWNYKCGFLRSCFYSEMTESIELKLAGDTDFLPPKIGSDHQTRNGNWQVPLDVQEFKATPVPSCASIERQY